MTLFQAPDPLFILPHPHMGRVSWARACPMFCILRACLSQVPDVVKEGMNQPINQWVLTQFPSLTIYYSLPKLFPLVPFKRP